MRELPEQSFLLNCFDYNPLTGELFWKERPVEHFSHCTYPRSVCSSWNKRLAGSPALDQMTKTGYLQGRLNGCMTLKHRVVYKIFHGEDALYIDHINGNRSDNKILNLRSVSRFENMKNLKMYTSNTSGKSGVSWHKGQEKWQVRIGNSGNRICLGYYSSLEEAVKVKEEKELELEYHENHGRN